MVITLIAKNLTGSPITLVQLAVTIPALGQISLTDFNDVYEIQRDDQLIQEITTGDIILNDGARDLTLEESLNSITPFVSPIDPGSFSPAFIAGEALSQGNILAVNPSGEVIKASSAFSDDKWQVMGVACCDVSMSSMVSVINMSGPTQIKFSSAPAASSNGEIVFLGSNPGEASLVPPLTSGNIVFIVGVLQGADGVSTTPSVIFQPRYVSRRP